MGLTQPSAAAQAAAALLALAFITQVLAAPCTQECGPLTNSWCDVISNTCKCLPGHGGINCSFSMASIFFEHNVYSDFRPERELDLQGWSDPEPIYRNVTNLIKPQFIIEVGTWKGLSASIFARYLKSQKSGVIVCVDTWLGAYEFWSRHFTHGVFDPSRNLHLKNGYPSVYYSFLSNMYHMKLTDYVVPFPAPSSLAATFMKGNPSFRADLIHIDAAHEYEDIRHDIAIWWPLVRPGGMLVGDDYSRWWPGVVRAADEFAKEQNLHLYINPQGNKWWVIKPLASQQAVATPGPVAIAALAVQPGSTAAATATKAVATLQATKLPAAAQATSAQQVAATPVQQAAAAHPAAAVVLVGTTTTQHAAAQTVQPTAAAAAAAAAAQAVATTSALPVAAVRSQGASSAAGISTTSSATPAGAQPAHSENPAAARSGAAAGTQTASSAAVATTGAEAAVPAALPQAPPAAGPLQQAASGSGAVAPLGSTRHPSQVQHMQQAGSKRGWNHRRHGGRRN
jgi:hypothetical protein